MKGSELEKVAATAPGAPLLAPSDDHSYQEVNVAVSTALYHPQHGWTEDHGDELTCESEWGERRPVLVVF